MLQYIKIRFSSVQEIRINPGWHARGGLEETSSSSKTACIIQRDGNDCCEASTILRSGNAPAPKESGRVSAKRELRSSRKAPRESPADRS